MARTEFCDVGGHCQEIYQALIGSKLSSIVLINQISDDKMDPEATFSHYVLHSHIDHNFYVLNISVSNSSFLLH